MKLESKVAVITGGTSGIGRATAILFGQEGSRVVVVGRWKCWSLGVRGKGITIIQIFFLKGGFCYGYQTG